MKKLFIPAFSKQKLSENQLIEITKNLPNKTSIYYSIQFQNKALQIKKQLEKQNKSTSDFSQVLGCSNISFKNSKAILLITTGKFHALNILINLKKLKIKIPCFILEANKLKKLNQKDLMDFQKIKKALYTKFLYSDKVGILISIKPGQFNIKSALQFKKSVKNKKSYLFICNNINSSEFENFPEIQTWVNTACTRIDLNKKIINLRDLI